MWLPEPPEGTPICLGFDGSDTKDWSAIRAETLGGYQFTPRYAGGRPTIWNPAQEPDHRISHIEVGAAVDEIFARFAVERFYCDPPRWPTDIEMWAGRHGEDRVLEWATNRPRQMYEALERFVADLRESRITHDDCPLTAQHIANARMKRTGPDQYGLTRPNDNQKIDAAITSVLAHEAAADARAAGWSDEPTDTRVFCFT